ncbi:hypothetical protein KXX60_006386, partial [Aspergillus fumigatus]
ILLESELGFSPKWFSGRGLGVGANETVWGRVVAPDGVGIQTHDLLACVAAPEEDPIDATKQAVQAIWDTMEQVACKSQQTV